MDDKKPSRGFTKHVCRIIGAVRRISLVLKNRKKEIRGSKRSNNDIFISNEYNIFLPYVIFT